MREIKFRVWNIDSGKMVTDPAFITVDGGGDFLVFDEREPDFDWTNVDMVLMQYIGLKDSFADEVYFCDVVKDDEDNYWRVDDARAAVVFENLKTGARRYFWEMGFFTVVGNIYENPELNNGQS